MKEFMYAFGSIMLIALVDYFLYNLVNRIKITYVKYYRMYQIILVILIGYWLYDLGVKYLICYLILFFTWWADFLYYIYYDTIKCFGGDYAGKAFKSEVLDNKVTWAWWTIYGIIHSVANNRKEPIQGNILLIQLLFGMLLTLIICFNK